LPIEVTERYGRRLSDAAAELSYLIRGTDDDGDARSALVAAVPGVHEGLVLDDVEVEELEGLDAYLGTARYVLAEFGQTGESRFSFDTTGGTQHITQSLATVGTFPAPGVTPPNFGGAIGVTTDSVEGVDITVPVYSFSETHYLPDSVVTLAYRGTVFNLTGKVNAGGFKGLAAGECLFLGATGSRRESEDDWEVTYRFAASPNKINLTIGDIPNVSKKGWEYLWVRYQESVDGGAQMLIKKPVAAYVERVYELGNFAALGIGT